MERNSYAQTDRVDVHNEILADYRAVHDALFSEGLGFYQTMVFTLEQESVPERDGIIKKLEGDRKKVSGSFDDLRIYLLSRFHADESNPMTASRKIRTRRRMMRMINFCYLQTRESFLSTMTRLNEIKADEETRRLYDVHYRRVETRFNDLINSVNNLF